MVLLSCISRSSNYADEHAGCGLWTITSHTLLQKQSSVYKSTPKPVKPYEFGERNEVFLASSFLQYAKWSKEIPFLPPSPSSPLPPSLTAPPSGPTYQGEVPTEDVHEKNAPAQAQPTPSAPPISSMDHVTGYENAGFQAGWLP